jgi:hypothetical protein
VKNKNPKKSGKSQGKIILKDTIFINYFGYGSLELLIKSNALREECRMKRFK